MLLGLRNFWVVAFVLVAVPEAESSIEILDSLQIDLFAKQKETHTRKQIYGHERGRGEA